MSDRALKKPIHAMLKTLGGYPGGKAILDPKSSTIRQPHSQHCKKLSPTVLQQGLNLGLIEINENIVQLTKAGIARLKREMCDLDPFTNQHRDLSSKTQKIRNELQRVTINNFESPLGRLYARKQSNGSRFISKIEYDSGERIRRDFELAQIQPSISSTWGEAMSSQKGRSYSAQREEFSDVALDAKARFEKAVNKLGPELAGVTVDICCFLKGLELVEREHKWPTRSAKLMLKTALAKLARHYGFCAPVVYRAWDASGEIGSWRPPDC